MFDVAPTELLLVAVVAVVVIGPKDLPKAMRVVGYWVGRARGVARQFRQGFDDMVREAEIHEMEKKWAEENARIMREFPADASPAALLSAPPPAPPMQEDSGPVMTATPDLFDPPADAPPPADDAGAAPAPAKRRAARAKASAAKTPAKPRAPRRKTAPKDDPAA